MTSEVAVRVLDGLVGETLTHVTVEKGGVDRVKFRAQSGRRWAMYHEQCCCEDVRIEDINGSIQDLLSGPIVLAEERAQTVGTEYGSATATWYEIRTAMGGVSLRWHGESNGFYSEAVTFEEVRDAE